MKKFIFLLCMGLLVVGFNAKAAKPDIIVHKSNGGYWAWLNLYNDIKYTPSDENSPAMLECMGAGYSRCRVPNVGAYMDNTGVHFGGAGSNVNYGVSSKFAEAVNEIIQYSEEQGAKGYYSGSKSHIIAVVNTKTRSLGSTNTYFVKGSWQYNKYGEGYLYIYITKSDILQTTICNTNKAVR